MSGWKRMRRDVRDDLCHLREKRFRVVLDLAVDIQDDMPILRLREASVSSTRQSTLVD